jgi:hypothetical protein
VWRAGIAPGRGRHRSPRGGEGTRPQLCLTRAEHGNPARVRAACGRCGRPIVRGAESPGGTGCPRSECRWPKGSRKPAPSCPVLPPGGAWITGRIPGLVPGRESALTWAGEPLKPSGQNPLEPRGKLGAGDGERTLASIHRVNSVDRFREPGRRSWFCRSGRQAFPAAHWFCGLSGFLDRESAVAGCRVLLGLAVTGSGLVRPRGRVGRWRLRTGSSTRSGGASRRAGAR